MHSEPLCLINLYGTITIEAVTQKKMYIYICITSVYINPSLGLNFKQFEQMVRT